MWSSHARFSYFFPLRSKLSYGFFMSNDFKTKMEALMNELDNIAKLPDSECLAISSCTVFVTWIH